MLPSIRCFPKAATLLGQVMEAVLCVSALGLICVHYDRGVPCSMDWLHCCQLLQKVVRESPLVEVAFTSKH